MPLFPALKFFSLEESKCFLLPLRPFGSMTFKKKSKKNGFLCFLFRGYSHSFITWSQVKDSAFKFFLPLTYIDCNLAKHLFENSLSS